MSFIRRLMGVDIIDSLFSVNTGYRALCEKQQRIMEVQAGQIDELKLEHLRNVRDLVEQFWLAQEAGLDVREALHAGLEDLRDHVARLEEHAR